MKIEELPTSEHFSGWSCVLPEGEYGYYAGVFSVVDGAKVEDVTADRIARVDAFWAEGGRDWADEEIAALVELTDGTWAVCLAWCDSSGWGCQQDVTWRWAPTRELAISQGLDQAARRNLDVPLPTDN